MWRLNYNVYGILSFFINFDKLHKQLLRQILNYFLHNMAFFPLKNEWICLQISSDLSMFCFRC